MPEPWPAAAALEHVADLEEQCSQWEEQRPRLTEEEERGLSELGRDLPALWNHPAASLQLKERILRTVLEEIVIADDERRSNHLLTIHWKGGVHTELQVPRNPAGKKANDIDKTPLQLIEELSRVCSDQAIAAILNRLGLRTGAGATWRIHSAYNARFIESPVCSEQIDGLLSGEDHRQLKLYILDQPERGDFIKGSDGLRKLRWAGSGRGKRGGIRVVYCLWRGDTVFLRFAYSKNKLSGTSNPTSSRPMSSRRSPRAMA